MPGKHNNVCSYVIERISVFIFALAIACFGVAGTRGQEPAVLTTLSSIRSIERNEVDDQRVDFEATVTYVDSFFAFLFVQDRDEAIFVFGLNCAEFQTGSVVRIRGKLVKGDLLPCVEASNITRLVDNGARPEPLIKALGDLEVTDDCMFVQTELLVLQAVVNPEDTLLFGRDTSGRELFIRVLHPDGIGGAEVSKLTDCRVRATGCLGIQAKSPAFGPKDERANEMLALKLFCSRLSDIENILDNEPFQPPRVAKIAMLTQKDFADGDFLTHAQISLIDYSGEPEVIISDDSGAMRISVNNTLDLIPGMVLRLGGRRTTDEQGQVRFYANFFRNLNISSLPHPAAITVGQAIEEFNRDHRINIVGRPVRIERKKGRPYLVLRDDDTDRSIVVKFQDDAFPALPLADPNNVKRVSITGVVMDLPANLAIQNDSVFQLVVGRSEDVVLVEKRASLSSIVPGTLAVLLAMFGFAAIWIKVLKVQVAQKTAVTQRISAQLRSSYEAIDDGVLAFDRNLSALTVNRGFCQISQLDVKTGQSVDCLRDTLAEKLREPDNFRTHWDSWKTHPHSRSSFEVVLKDNNAFVAIDSAPILGHKGELIGRILILRDETEKKNMLAELLHSNRLEAVGQLVAGVAHDFNNVLTAIVANLSVARLDRGKTVAAVEEELAVAEEAAFRGGEIVKRLLTFSTKNEFDLEPCSINSIIERLRELVRHTIDASVRFEFELAECDPYVNVEGAAIEQVLMNLYVNAVDAMPDGGVIQVSTCVQQNSVTDQSEVVVTVKDTGVGVAPEIRDKLFEPYVTTKDKDHGTGLGLSVSYRVVQQNGGLLLYRNRNSGGSEFRIILPLEESQLLGSENGRVSPPIGTGTILVIDDEVEIRTVAQSILRRLGYATFAACDGREAIKILKRDAAQIDAVLLDLTMPGMTGKEVFSLLRKEWPQLRIVVCSGYLIDGAFHTGTPTDADGVLAKPYNATDLGYAVAKALSGSSLTA